MPIPKSNCSRHSRPSTPAARAWKNGGPLAWQASLPPIAIAGSRWRRPTGNWTSPQVRRRHGQSRQETTFTLDQYINSRSAPGATAALNGLALRLLGLEGQANPLMREVVTGYQGLCARLAHHQRAPSPNQPRGPRPISRGSYQAHGSDRRLPELVRGQPRGPRPAVLSTNTSAPRINWTRIRTRAK